MKEQHIDPDSQADVQELLVNYLKMGKGEAVFCVDPDCFRGPSSHKSAVGDSHGWNRVLVAPGRCPLVTPEHTMHAPFGLEALSLRDCVRLLTPRVCLP